MNNSSTQIEKDILFLQDQCEMSNEQCDEIINACEDLGGISAEYFCEEFVFACTDSEGNEDVDALDRIHDDDYLNIAEFNAMYWEGI